MLGYLGFPLDFHWISLLFTTCSLRFLFHHTKQSTSYSASRRHMGSTPSRCLDLALASKPKAPRPFKLLRAAAPPAAGALAVPRSLRSAHAERRLQAGRVAELRQLRALAVGVAERHREWVAVLVRRGHLVDSNAEPFHAMSSSFHLHVVGSTTLSRLVGQNSS